MPAETTLKAALRRFGIEAKTHIGAPWTYASPAGEVVHLCWREGASIAWRSSADGTLTYRDAFNGFDPANAGANARDSFALLTAAQERNSVVRCILVSGSKQSGTRYSAREDLEGSVTMAIPESGKGIEIVFRNRQGIA